MNTWIDVTKRLPDYDVYVLWRYEDGGIIHSCIDHDSNEESIKLFLEGQGLVQGVRGKITHWMPEPDLPETKIEDEPRKLLKEIWSNCICGDYDTEDDSVRARLHCIIEDLLKDNWENFQ